MEKLLAFLGGVPRDKLLHLVGGLLTFAVAAPVSLALGYGLLHALAVVAAEALLKEAYDAAYNYWVAPVHGVELNDALATICGGLVGLACARCDAVAHWLVAVAQQHFG